MQGERQPEAANTHNWRGVYAKKVLMRAPFAFITVSVISKSIVRYWQMRQLHRAVSAQNLSHLL
jgi:CO/xanthine dehydrogenase FAD-binding subunit